MIPDHSRFQIFVVVVVQWLNHVYKYRNIYTLSITHASSVHSLPIVVQLCLTLCIPMDCSMPGFPVLHHLLDFAQTHVHWVSNTIQPSHPLSSLLLLPSVFPNIKVFPCESALHITWPKYWSFRFSISPSNDYSGLISFRIDLFDLLAVQRTLKSLLQHYN